ncbi:alpha/beta fold hydrolase [Actinomycetospora sp. CA-101289]|uniref:alpha/beta fold hydrolase n=1 Tax=Actinomycetospora sp. CA-101289 TaxID=3239893 RepID=UPI003D975A63
MPEVRSVHRGDVRIAYESFGDLAHGEPLLLVMGLDFQMVWWPEELVGRLVDAGFAVVRFDNRDTGLSTACAPLERPRPYRALLGGVAPAYTSRDMVDDALAVMDAVGWADAHVVGASMGAALAQGAAAEDPHRVRSLVSIMGTPADVGLLRTARYVRPGVFRTLARIRPGETDEEQVEALVAIYRALWSPAQPFPEEWARATARTSHARRPRDRATTQRQLAAGRAHRFPDPATISAPTLVINGLDDPLIRWTAGRDTARRIPGARFVAHPGMGHAVPPALFGAIVDDVRRVADRALSR